MTPLASSSPLSASGYLPSSSATPKTSQIQTTAMPTPMEKEPLDLTYSANVSPTPAAPSRNGNSPGTSSSTPKPSLIIRLPIAISPPGSAQKPAEFQPESFEDEAVEDRPPFEYPPPSPSTITPIASPKYTTNASNASIPRPQEDPQPQELQSITSKCCNNVKPTAKPKSDQDKLLQAFTAQYWGDITTLQRVSSKKDSPDRQWSSFDTIIRIIYWEDKSDFNAHEKITYGITNGLDIVEISPEKKLEVVTPVDSMTKREECLIRVGGGVTLDCVSHPKREYVVYEVDWQKARSKEEVKEELEEEAGDSDNAMYWKARELLGLDK
jgi:hypothetical protein